LNCFVYCWLWPWVRENASRTTPLRQEDQANYDLQNPEFRERWAHIAEPGWEINQQIFNRADRHRTKVLHCAIPLTQAKRLTDATFPPGWNCRQAFGRQCRTEARPELENWEYTPQIRAAPQFPYFKTLPPEHSTLQSSPWFQSPSQASGIGLNARHLRHHHQLWNELRPKTLRGVHTTLVYVTPQLG
jgi:hypothetical protein